MLNMMIVQLCYNAEDLLPLCENLDVPLVFGSLDVYLFCTLPLFLQFY